LASAIRNSEGEHMTIKLEFQSPPLKLQLLTVLPLFATLVDGWEVAESFQADRFRHQGVWYGEYRMELRYDVPADEDGGSAYIAGCYLARQLDRVWTYSTGLPFGARAYDWFLTPTNPPQDWNSNAREALPVEDWSLLQSRISYAAAYRTMPNPPLKATIEVMKAVSASDEVIDQLCSYHFEALSTTEGDVHFLLLAQGLEIARTLLAGDTTPAKQQNLPEAVAILCRRDLNWLFNMMQQRRQTRHAIDKGRVVVLKKAFADEEEDDYLHDANLIIQHVVAERLKIPLVWNEMGRTIEVLERVT
jgi:hypothetical protein